MRRIYDCFPTTLRIFLTFTLRAIYTMRFFLTIVIVTYVIQREERIATPS